MNIIDENNKNVNVNPVLHLDNDNSNSNAISDYLGVEDHPKIQLLSMAFNVIENLNFLWEDRFVNLNILNLSFNKLTNIDAIEYIPNLKILRCTSNKITELPSVSTFACLTMLEEFWINRNKLINLQDTILALTAATSLKKLVLCKNPCCKTSIDALYFHFVVANLDSLDILDGKRITPTMKVKGIDYISSPLGQNLVLQMSQRGKISDAPGPYARRPRSQPKSARAKMVTVPPRSRSHQVLAPKRKVRSNSNTTFQSNITNSRPTSPNNDDHHNNITEGNDDNRNVVDQEEVVEQQQQEQKYNNEDSNEEKPPELEQSVLSEPVDNDQEEEEEEDRDISTLGFDSISSMLPSFSSSKLSGNTKYKKRPPRPSKYRNTSKMKQPVITNRRVKTKRRSLATSEESRYKSLGLSSASTQILRESRLASNNAKKTQRAPSPISTKKPKNVNLPIKAPTNAATLKTNGSSRASKKGVRIRKKSLTTAVKEPTPLPESLASWEDGKAEKVVDFSTISSLLPDFSSKLSKQMEDTRKQRTKNLPRGRRKKKEEDTDSVFQSEYMRNKGRRKTKTTRR